MLTWLLLPAELLLAGVLGLGLVGLGVEGIAWIAAGLLAGAIGAALWSRWQAPLQPNRMARKIGQALVGLDVGLLLHQRDLSALTPQLPVFVAIVAVLLTGGVGIGYLYARLEGTDLLTGALATTPGNVSIMASIAADYHRSAPLVSLVQLLRFTTVTSTIPLLVHSSHTPTQGSLLQSLVRSGLDLPPAQAGRLALLLGLTGLVVALGERLRLPIAPLLGSIATGAVLLPLLQQGAWFPAGEVALPAWLVLGGQMLLGITIGEYWGINPRLSRWTLLRATVPVALTVLVGLAAAALAHWLTPWDWLTCLLVTAPGGSPEMIGIAVTLGQAVPIVTTGHVVRLVALNLILPLLVALTNRLESASPAPTPVVDAGQCVEPPRESPSAEDR